MTWVGLLSVAPDVGAQICTASVNTATYAYSAATLADQAEMLVNVSLSCRQVPAGTPMSLCVTPNFTALASKDGSTESLPYTVGLYTPVSVPMLMSGVTYGPYPVGTASNAIVQGMGALIRLTVPAGAAVSRSAGTYRANVPMVVEYSQPGWPCDGMVLDPSSQFNVSARANVVIPSSCSVSASAGVAFGQVPGNPTLLSDLDAQGAVAVTCGAGTPYTIYLGDGLNRGSGTGYRQMANGAHRLPYQLYQDPARSRLWEQAAGSGVVGSGDGTAHIVPVYGRIAAGTVLPPPGDYEDAVIVTVTY